MMHAMPETWHPGNSKMWHNIAKAGKPGYLWQFHMCTSLSLSKSLAIPYVHVPLFIKIFGNSIVHVPLFIKIFGNFICALPSLYQNLWQFHMCTSLSSSKSTDHWGSLLTFHFFPKTSLMTDTLWPFYFWVLLAIYFHLWYWLIHRLLCKIACKGEPWRTSILRVNITLIYI